MFQNNFGSDRKKQRLFLFIAVAACIAAVLFFAKRNDRLTTTSSAQHRIYYYRTISFGYDSVCISGICGEITLTNSNHDTLDIVNPIWNPGEDTTIDYINSLVMTNNFSVHKNTILKLFRSIRISEADSTAMNYGIADTTTFTIEIFNASNSSYISTLDTFGAYPVVTCKRYPYVFGTDTINKNLTFNLTGIKNSDIYSCFLKFRAHRYGSGIGLSQINISDLTYNEPLSNHFTASMRQENKEYFWIMMLNEYLSISITNIL